VVLVPELVVALVLVAPDLVLVLGMAALEAVMAALGCYNLHCWNISSLRHFHKWHQSLQKDNCHMTRHHPIYSNNNCLRRQMPPGQLTAQHETWLPLGQTLKKPMLRC